MRWGILVAVGLAAISCILLAACDQKVKADPRVEETPRPEVVHNLAGLVNVEHPEQFPIATAARYVGTQTLSVTGVVSADVSRNVPVISLASGRVVEIDARLGDEVKRDQLLFKVRSTDIAQAFSDYRKAIENEQLANVQLDRAKMLYETGAIAAKDLEVAQNAENNAKVDLDTTAEHLRALGADLNNPTGIVNIYAPVSGVITDQQITTSAGVQALSSASPFTISDLSYVWIICDVYENNLPQVHLNAWAEIHLAAYPNRIVKGKISNIAPILDPAIRTAKVRLEVENPGILRPGMFVTAEFHDPAAEMRATVPASAVLHLHDRDWVYVPQSGHAFRRVEVVGGQMIPNGQQEIISGIRPGDRVVTNALDLQYTANQ
jgi:cobalt-zinc-cadmium efflux system membrane fusion protein